MLAARAAPWRRPALATAPRAFTTHYCFSTDSKPSGTRRAKPLSLTPFVSPLLLKLHPDTIQRHAPELADANEQALKQLNLFLELAVLGCNNDAFRARKHVLALAESRHDDPDAPVRFPLVFHVPQADETIESDAPSFEAVTYTVEVPGRLVRRTLANPARTSRDRSDPQAAIQAPFARDWQRTTKRILQDLFAVAHVPLVVPGEDEEGEEKPTALALWLAEADTAVDEADRHGIRVGAYNRSRQRSHEKFDEEFHAMLTREKNIVHDITTGLEDGPTAQHAVLTSLLKSRLLLPKFEDPHQKKSAFHWVANLLLINFMELRLHSLVWNKITLLVTADTTVEDPQVIWDENAPQEGMGILVPVGMEPDAFVDFVYEHVEELELALSEKSERDHAEAEKEKQRRRREKQEKQAPRLRSRRKGHFYADEVAAIFRKR